MTKAKPMMIGADLLVVDDTPANLRLLAEMLQARGYRVRPVPNGPLALQAATMDPPDLVLLDITMPGMDGYQGCERLKADGRLRDIPVIFVSAMHEVIDKTRAFHAGGVDYVTKPFHFDEVEARVRTHLEIAHLRRELQEHNARLEETVAHRTRQLAEARARLEVLDRAKGDFISLISHELRTPLHGILGVTEMLLTDHPESAGAGEYWAIYEQSRRRIMTLVEDALLLAEVGAGVDAGLDRQSPLAALLEEARAEAEAVARERGVTLAPCPAGLGAVRGTPAYLVRALKSLLETATKFAREGTLVRLSASAEAALIIEADGLAIPPESLPRFFSLLAIAEAITPGGDLGVAPALAERIVSLYGGSVAVENLQPPGIRLIVQLAGRRGHP